MPPRSVVMGVWGLRFLPLVRHRDPELLEPRRSRLRDATATAEAAECAEHTGAPVHHHVMMLLPDLGRLCSLLRFSALSAPSAVAVVYEAP